MHPAKIKSFGISDIGHVRANNEDVWMENLRIPFFILADGMGGHNAGEIAAKVAVINLSQQIDDFFFSRKTKPSTMEVSAFLQEAIRKTSSLVFDLSEENYELNGMGTTLCCLIFHEGTAIYGHVGDSRIYQFKEELTQLTIDHSLRAELMTKGESARASVQRFPYKNVITRAVGTSKNVRPDVGTCPLESKQVYILCSDGLTDCVSDDQIAATVQRRTSVEQAGQELIKIAKEKGGNDNITAILIEVL
jgi:serine/threonine protein phosphatase PrpC